MFFDAVVCLNYEMDGCEKNTRFFKNGTFTKAYIATSGIKMHIFKLFLNPKNLDYSVIFKDILNKFGIEKKHSL